MEDAPPYPTYNTQYPMDTTQRQMPHGVQANRVHTFPVVNSAGQNDYEKSAVETLNRHEGSEFTQATELSLDVSLASMNLNDGAATQEFIHSAAIEVPVDSSSVVDGNAGAGAALDACMALKNELDAALNAYRQSREVMLWHAANVCRVNLEYIRALQAANRVHG